ncbi:Uncharacterised protein [Mycobacteroides abscessus]|nr:Uncharacterised protein [Mycobacteroides abscessus]
MSTRHGSATVVLPSDTRILIARSFDAPAALIFRALTEPELVGIRGRAVGSLRDRSAGRRDLALRGAPTL